MSAGRMPLCMQSARLDSDNFDNFFDFEDFESEYLGDMGS
jgi:hypothetical protein